VTAKKKHQEQQQERMNRHQHRKPQLLMDLSPPKQARLKGSQEV
jgi:hypothetical protein